MQRLQVVWPNIELDTHKIDFGTVLNDTSKKMEAEKRLVSLSFLLGVGRNLDSR